MRVDCIFTALGGEYSVIRGTALPIRWHKLFVQLSIYTKIEHSFLEITLLYTIFRKSTYHLTIFRVFYMLQEVFLVEVDLVWWRRMTFFLSFTRIFQPLSFSDPLPLADCLDCLGAEARSLRLGTR